MSPILSTKHSLKSNRSNSEEKLVNLHFLTDQQGNSCLHLIHFFLLFVFGFSDSGFPPPQISESEACIKGTFQGLTVPLTCAGHVANLTLPSIYWAVDFVTLCSVDACSHKGREMKQKDPTATISGSQRSTETNSKWLKQFKAGKL